MWCMAFKRRLCLLAQQPVPHRVLSLVYLGMRVILHDSERITVGPGPTAIKLKAPTYRGQAKVRRNFLNLMAMGPGPSPGIAHDYFTDRLVCLHKFVGSSDVTYC
jgi:hypothetical protein